MRLLRHASAFVFIASLVVAATPVAAQNRRPMGAEAQREPARGGGTIRGPAMGGMEVVGAQGERFIVQLEPRAQQVEYAAAAETSWLHSGLLVRFTTVIDKRGRLLEPVSQLDVITLREGYQLGVQADSGFDASKESDGLFEEAKPEKPAKKQPPAENMPVTVIGRLTEFKNGKFQVAVPGGRPLKGELTENAKVSVDYGNLSLVRAGDKIEFQGWSPAGMKQIVFANQVTVTAAKPLAGEVKKKPRTDPNADKDDDAKPSEKPAEKSAE
jgi:hypothetical protein